MGWLSRRCGTRTEYSECEPFHGIRMAVEGLLKGDSSGSARLGAVDERINRALADAVERHATKGPGMTGILERVRRTHPSDHSRTVEDTRARHGQTAEGGSQPKGNHVKSAMSNRAPLNSAFREGSSGRLRHKKSAQLLSPRRRHWAGTVGKR